MDTLRILIVEDELSFSLELEMLVQKIGYQVAGMVDNADDALQVIHNSQVDLILMDVDINGTINGIELGKQIKHLNIPILFITSYSDETHYKAAQESKMIGYFVKPISSITLRSTINLALTSLAVKSGHSAFEENTETDGFIFKDFLFFKRQNLFFKIPKVNILYIAAQQNYINVYTRNGGIYFAKMTLNKIMENLPKNLFMRVHRSYIIQLHAIDSIDFNQSTLHIGDAEIPISRSNKKLLEEKIMRFD